MRRDQLEHAIRAAAQLVGLDSVVVIGSQSILGTWSEDMLPPEATMSREVDILPLTLSPADTEELAEKLGALGELTLFDETHGFHIDGVDMTTAVLPQGWHERLVPVKSWSAGTNKEYTGLCLDPLDLCVAKLIAHRDKDRQFVQALLTAELVRASDLLERLALVQPPPHVSLDAPFGWLLDR